MLRYAKDNFMIKTMNVQHYVSSYNKELIYYRVITCQDKD